MARWLSLFVALLAAAPARALLPVPELTGPVVDQARLLDADGSAQLEQLAREARARDGGQGPQLQFLLVPSLEGETIEDLSIRVAEAWKIGTRGKDNGVLVTVSRDDHKIRIEVGGGLEGRLTDAQAGRIIRETMAPAFRAGRYGEGLREAAAQILGAVGSEPEPPMPEPLAPEAPARSPFLLTAFGVLLGLFPIALVVLAIIFMLRWFLDGSSTRYGRVNWGGGSSRDRWGSGDSWSSRSSGSSWGSSSSGGSSSGGSWSGGGGGFSGGGASGSW